jgi:hypothetical protein
MKLGFVSDGAMWLEKALRKRIRSEVEARYAAALAKNSEPGLQFDLRVQIELEIKDEIRRKKPGPGAMFIA